MERRENVRPSERRKRGDEKGRRSEQGPGGAKRPFPPVLHRPRPIQRDLKEERDKGTHRSSRRCHRPGRCTRACSRRGLAGGEEKREVAGKLGQHARARGRRWRRAQRGRTGGGKGEGEEGAEGEHGCGVSGSERVSVVLEEEEEERRVKKDVVEETGATGQRALASTRRGSALNNKKISKQRRASPSP